MALNVIDSVQEFKSLASSENNFSFVIIATCSDERHFRSMTCCKYLNGSYEDADGEYYSHDLNAFMGEFMEDYEILESQLSFLTHLKRVSVLEVESL